MLQNKIKTLLDEAGMSQAELARGIGVRPSTVSDWTKNKVQPDPKSIEAICHFFNIETQDVIYIAWQKTETAH